MSINLRHYKPLSLGCSALACALAPIASGCSASQPVRNAPAVPITITSEELRLWDIKQLNMPLQPGSDYEVVGKLRSIQATEQGEPKLVFTGVEAILTSAVPSNVVQALTPESYVALHCRLSRNRESIFVTLRQCTGATPVIESSAYDYWKAYEDNPFKADAAFKDKPIVIHGTVRLVDKLTNGAEYVALNAQDGFSDVTAILGPNTRSVIRRYAKVGRDAHLFCTGGKRWNQIGSVGLANCEVIQDD